VPSLDRLRGTFLRAPRWAKAAGGPLLALTPTTMLYGRTFARLQTDIVRSEWDAAFVEERVQVSLRRLLALAATTAFYRERLAHLRPEGATRADLTTLPILTRDQVRDNADHMLAVPRTRLDMALTSSTSWSRLAVYLDKDRSAREWAFVTHAWQAGGYRVGDRRAVLRYNAHQGTRSDTWSWEPATRELRLSPFRMVPRVMDEYLDLIERFRVAYIHGYPSAIALLAKHAEAVQWSPPATLKGILPISESLLPGQRESIHRGFGQVAIVPFYGLTEKVAFAREAPSMPDVYEFEPLYGVAEVVDDRGRPVIPGERGRLVGTGFISTGMPFIRYYTGDLATVVRPAAAGNCWRLRVKDLVSAHQQLYLATREGGLVTTTLVYPCSDAIQDYQYVQHEPGVVRLRVVPAAGASRAEVEAAAHDVAARTGGLLSVHVDVVDEILPTARGKRIVVRQHLDLSPRGHTAGG
jgi:phenylacetate-CoA ligase